MAYNKGPNISPGLIYFRSLMIKPIVSNIKTQRLILKGLKKWNICGARLSTSISDERAEPAEPAEPAKELNPLLHNQLPYFGFSQLCAVQNGRPLRCYHNGMSDHRIRVQWHSAPWPRNQRHDCQRTENWGGDGWIVEWSIIVTKVRWLCNGSQHSSRNRCQSMINRWLFPLHQWKWILVLKKALLDDESIHSAWFFSRLTQSSTFTRWFSGNKSGKLNRTQAESM